MSDLRANAPAEVRFLFQQSQKRSAGALAVSLGIHGVLFGLAVWIAMNPTVQQSTSTLVDNVTKDIVWLNVPGPGGGGGGGGNQNPEPVKKVELKGPDKEGRRAFVLSEKIAVSFKKDAAGKVVSLTLYQSGMSFELPRDKQADTEPPKK